MAVNWHTARLCGNFEGVVVTFPQGCPQGMAHIQIVHSKKKKQQTLSLLQAGLIEVVHRRELPAGVKERGLWGLLMVSVGLVVLPDLHQSPSPTTCPATKNF